MQPIESCGHILKYLGRRTATVQNERDNTRLITPRQIRLKPKSYDKKEEIKTGEARICCYIDGEVKEYTICITQIDKESDQVNKGMVIQVTDTELLEKTGGIIQGMSGSPIIQNGKLIGAVTHVFVQDSTKGYGIFIENMLKEEES